MVAMRWSAGVRAVLGAVVLTGGAAARGDAFGTYGRAWRGFSTPPVGEGSFGVAADALADGRLVLVTGASVFLERAPGAGAFDVVARLDAARLGGATDPSFVRVSPDGSRVAVGSGFGKPVVVFASSALGTPDAPTELDASRAGYFDAPHFDGAWLDGQRLALTAGTFGEPSVVTVLDTASNPERPDNTVVVRNIGGASAGVAIDAAGNLYTGNGFDFGSGGSETGSIKAFAPELWLREGGVDFEGEGVLIGEVLSAGGLVFDLEGNLAVGGGDFSDGDVGYLGVLSASALASALGGGGPIDVNDPASLGRLDPLGTGGGYFGAGFNRATLELYAGAGTRWYATVPGPGASVAVCVAGVALAGRRRTRAHA